MLGLLPRAPCRVDSLGEKGKGTGQDRVGELLRTVEKRVASCHGRAAPLDSALLQVPFLGPVSKVTTTTIRVTLEGTCTLRYASSEPKPFLCYYRHAPTHLTLPCLSAPCTTSLQAHSMHLFVCCVFLSWAGQLQACHYSARSTSSCPAYITLRAIREGQYRLLSPPKTWHSLICRDILAPHKVHLGTRI